MITEVGKVLICDLFTEVGKPMICDLFTEVGKLMICDLFTEVGKRASVLVSANATNILFQLIYREAEDQLSSEETMMLAHFVLGKLAQKGNNLRPPCTN